MKDETPAGPGLENNAGQRRSRKNFTATWANFHAARERLAADRVRARNGGEADGGEAHD